MKRRKLVTCLTAASAVVGLAAVAQAQPQLTLNADPVCFTDTEVTVSIDVSNLGGQEVCGGQFFLAYENTVLDFKSIKGGGPFTNVIFTDVDEAAGTIDYAVAVPLSDPCSAADTAMAVINFNILVPVCNSTGLVTFRTHVPPTRLTDDLGNEILSDLNDLADVGDTTPPDITPPADIDVQADADLGCFASVNPGTATATDNCTAMGPNDIVGVRKDGLPLTDPYPSGSTIINWTATDECGNVDKDQQVITVSFFNDLMLDIELQPVVEDGPFTRGITLELLPATGPPVVEVCVDLLFSTGSFSGTVEVPCGNYTCITARDTLHTLRRTASLVTTGSDPVQYVTTFVDENTVPPGDPAWDPALDHSLIGGNFNDDCWIDILDVGVFMGEFGSVKNPNTPCGTPFPHCDVSGNGVNFVEDFTFILINFLRQSEPDCSGVPCVLAADGGPGGPITRISVKELRKRGLHDLIAADLNHDGWLDVLDMIAFMLGERP